MVMIPLNNNVLVSLYDYLFGSTETGILQRRCIHGEAFQKYPLYQTCILKSNKVNATSFNLIVTTFASVWVFYILTK